MKQLLGTIHSLIEELPGRDSALCKNYLEHRDFISIHEIVKSDLYKASMSDDEVMYTDKYVLLKLKSALEKYMSYMYTSDYFDDLYEYYD